VVEGCLFEGIGRDATVSERGAGGEALHAGAGIHDTRVANNEFRNNLNQSISWFQIQGVTGPSVIERNMVTNSGTMPGYGGSGSWHAVGILIGRAWMCTCSTTALTAPATRACCWAATAMRSSTTSSTTPCPRSTTVRASTPTVRRSTIRHNIILDAKGGMEPSGTWPDISHGIWLEFLGQYHDSINRRQHLRRLRRGRHLPDQ